MTLLSEYGESPKLMAEIERLKDENAALTDLVAKLRKSLEISDNAMLNAIDKLFSIERKEGEE